MQHRLSLTLDEGLLGAEFRQIILEKQKLTNVDNQTLQIKTTVDIVGSGYKMQGCEP
jgi:hypothetical protein